MKQQLTRLQCKYLKNLDKPKIMVNPYERQKYLLDIIRVERAYIEQDIKWENLNRKENIHLF
jgi:hypothetical protein